MEGELRAPVLCLSCEALCWKSRSLFAPCSSDCGEQSSTSVVFAQAFDANHFVTRSLTPSKSDCALRDIQFFGEKTTQSGIRFSFYCRRAQFDPNRITVLANDFIALRIWNDMEP